MHACIHKHIFIDVHTYIHTCIHTIPYHTIPYHTIPYPTYIHTYTHIRTWIHEYIHTYIHEYIHTYMHACMHACMHAYIHTYIQTYIPPLPSFSRSCPEGIPFSTSRIPPFPSTSVVTPPIWRTPGKASPGTPQMPSTSPGPQSVRAWCVCHIGTPWIAQGGLIKSPRIVWVWSASSPTQPRTRTCRCWTLHRTSCPSARTCPSLEAPTPICDPDSRLVAGFPELLPVALYELVCVPPQPPPCLCPDKPGLCLRHIELVPGPSCPAFRKAQISSWPVLACWPPLDV